MSAPLEICRKRGVVAVLASGVVISLTALTGGIAPAFAKPDTDPVAPSTTVVVPVAEERRQSQRRWPRRSPKAGEVPAPAAPAAPHVPAECTATAPDRLPQFWRPRRQAPQSQAPEPPAAVEPEPETQAPQPADGGRSAGDDCRSRLNPSEPDRRPPRRAPATSTAPSAAAPSAAAATSRRLRPGATRRQTSVSSAPPRRRWPRHPTRARRRRRAASRHRRAHQRQRRDQRAEKSGDEVPNTPTVSVTQAAKEIKTVEPQTLEAPEEDIQLAKSAKPVFEQQPAPAAKEDVAAFSNSIESSLEIPGLDIGREREDRDRCPARSRLRVGQQCAAMASRLGRVRRVLPAHHSQSVPGPGADRLHLRLRLPGSCTSRRWRGSSSRRSSSRHTASPLPSSPRSTRRSTPFKP